MALRASELYSLLNVTEVTGLLDSYKTAPAIFREELIAPQDFTGTDFINFYMTGPYDPSIGYGEYIRSVNCHGKTAGKSQAIGLAVVEAVNRVGIENGRAYAEMLETLPPADDTDVYNTPVTVVIKADL